MASERDVKDLVARVTADVLSETRASEGSFKVADLTAHLRDIAKGDEVAWTISYSTAAASLADSIRVRGGDVAWTISYSTSATALTQGIAEKTK